MNTPPPNVVELRQAIECGIAADRGALAAVLRQYADMIEDPAEPRIRRVLIIEEDENGEVDHGSYGERTSHAEALWMVEKTRFHIIASPGEEE